MKNNKEFITGIGIVLGIALLIVTLVYSIFFTDDGEKEDSNTSTTRSEQIITIDKMEGSSFELPSSLNSEEIQLHEEIQIAGGYSYSNEDLQKAKETALKFIEIILPFDSDTPTLPFEDERLQQLAYSESTELILTALKEMDNPNIYLSKNILKRTIDRLEVVDSDFYHTDEMFINVLAHTETTYVNSVPTKEEYFYNVFLEKNLEGTYKVSSIYRFE